MRILITGANGFVGSHISTYLSGQGIMCVALDLPQVAPQGTYAERYTWDDLSKLDPDSFDGIIHLAGKAHDTRNTSDPARYFEINVGLTRTISSFYFQQPSNKLRKFIFFSSVKACADTVQGILTETQTPLPQTAYGQSKLEAEQVVLQYADHCSGLYILRPAMIHGPGNKGNLNLLYQVAKRGIPWPLGSFHNQRSFTSIGNMCAIVGELLIHPIVSGIYNVADDESLSTNELIALVASVRGKHPHILRVPEKLVRVVARLGDRVHLPLNSERLKKLTESYVVSNAKLKKALGWSQLPMTAHAGLDRTLRSFQT